MAATPLEFTLASGSGALDIILYPDGSDLSAGSVTNVTEETNRKRLWVATVTATLTGLHYVVITGNGAPADVRGSGWVDLEDNTVIHKVEGSKALALLKSTINDEIVDALDTDTYAEPGSGAPPATNTLASKIGYLYKLMRNKKEQTTSEFRVFNDDTITIDHKCAVSDDGVTATKQELGAP